MELIEKTIQNIRAFVEEKPDRKILTADPYSAWSVGGPRNIVLNHDMGLELGNPKDESVSCLLWSENLHSIKDGAITLIGPDFQESSGKSLPFAKIVLAGVEGFTEENTYDLYREMDFLRYDLDLKGFMLRAVSQHHREWCRISKEALGLGFSSIHLASALMKLLKEKNYVRSVEIIFFTSSSDDVKKISEIVNPAFRMIAAMDKMAQELDYDCGSCEYQDVCDEAEEMKAMRERFMKKTQEVGRG